MSISAEPSGIAEFNGRVVQVTDTDYNELRQVFNGMWDRKPSIIARCTSTADVAAAIAHARENTLAVSVYSGGHGVTGHAVCDNGIVIDMREVAGVQVDPDAKTARVGGGATWGVVDAATQEHGLAVTGGRVPGTGVAGLTLGSGSGWIERKFGLTCDSLRSAEVVTAAGDIVRASEDENADLFWGLRGGGGNFGVVTEFEFDLHPLGPIVYAGMIMHPGFVAGELLPFFRDFMKDAPDEVGAGVAFLSAPPEDFVPEEARGKPALGVIVCYAGDPAEAEEAMRPLVDWGEPAVKMVQPMPYVAVQQLIEPGSPKGMRNYWAADFVELPDEACAIVADYGNRRPSPLSQVIIVPGGGAVSRVDNEAMAFGQREAPFNIHLLSMWADPADDDANIAFTKEFNEALNPFKQGGAYLNFIGDEGGDRVREAFGPEKYAKLQALKDRYDPDNLFRLNQNVRPGAPASA